jgi:hypothetical protein
LLTYGQSGRSLSPGVTIGSTADYSDAAVGLDGSIYVRAPSNTANRYAISERSGTPTETYSVGAFGFFPNKQGQRIHSPKTVSFTNAGGLFGYFDELDDGTYYGVSNGISGSRGVIWTGADTGYASPDVSTGFNTYVFDLSAPSASVIHTGSGSPNDVLNFPRQREPDSAKIYVLRNDKDSIAYIDTSDDSINDIVTGLSLLFAGNLFANSVVASDGYLYAFLYDSGTSTGYLERFDLSDGSSAGSLDLGNQQPDWMDESPADGRLWIRMFYQSASRMVGVNKSTLEVEVWSEPIPDGITLKVPLGFTETGLLALTGSTGGSYVYYTLAT